MTHPIAVLAGTPVDTQLGVDFLTGAGLSGSAFPLSAAALTVVLAIEQGEDPDQLVEHHHLAELANWFAACGMEALLLGCTHFPYFKEALARRTSLPLIDPAREMLELLQA